MILDLGCGTVKVSNAIGVDKFPIKGVDILAELDKYPYPFANDTFDEIYLNDVIEHLPNTILTMEEIYRICRPNARVFIRVVNWNSHYTAMDPTHVKAFTENSFDFFGKNKVRSYYTFARFEVIKVDYQYNKDAEKCLRNRRLMKFLSNYLCNILEGLNFELRVDKKPTSNRLTSNKYSNIYDLIRCPNCLKIKGKRSQSKLRLYKRTWLICESNKCGYKYPVYRGLPYLFFQEGEKWKKTLISKLPIPPPERIDILQTNN
ncbi:MAG: methyltransferase domain-containing protein [Bacteroidota bacterium]